MTIEAIYFDDHCKDNMISCDLHLDLFIFEINSEFYQ